MNRELILKVADLIEEHPENFWMWDWALCDIESEDDREPFIGAECGTAACVAGWVMLESGWIPKYAKYKSPRSQLLGEGGQIRAYTLSHWEHPDGCKTWVDNTAKQAAFEMGLFSEDDLPIAPGEVYRDVFHWYDATPEEMAAFLRDWVYSHTQEAGDVA